MHEDAFARHWRDPARCRTLTARQRRALLNLTCGTGVVANMEVAAQVAGVALRPEDMAAAEVGGHLEAVKYLKDQDCPWDATATEAAAGGGHVKTVAWLADKGCPLSEAALAAAVRGGHTDMVQRLLALRCPVGLDAYRFAGSTGRQDVAELLLNRRPTAEGLRALLVGAAEGYSLTDLQALLTRLLHAYAESIGNSVPLSGAQKLLLSPVRRGALLAAASLHSRTPDWRAKADWLLDETGLERCILVPQEDYCEGGPGEHSLLLAERACQLEWLSGHGVVLLRARRAKGAQGPPNAAERATRDGDVAGLRRAMGQEGIGVGQRWARSAVEAGHVGVVMELGARGVLTLRDAVHWAAAAGQLGLLSRLLGEGGQRQQEQEQQQGQGRGQDQEPGAAGGQPVVQEATVGEAGAALGDGRDGTWLAGAAGVLDAGLMESVASSVSPSMDVLRWLRARGCPWGESVFAAAAGACSEEVVEWMAAEGCPMGVSGGGGLQSSRA